MEQRNCRECGVEFTPNHGRNVYCSEHRSRDGRRKVAIPYPTCGAVSFKSDNGASTRRYCSLQCRPTQKRVCQLPMSHPVRALIRQQSKAAQPKTSLRIAVESRDWPGIFNHLSQTMFVVAENDCWHWSGRTKRGYPVLRVGGRQYAAHRLMVEAWHRAELGSQPVHHKCANTMCINPRHLQPVSARENSAEMLARTYLESRIRDLEAALLAADPDNPLLHQIGLAA